MNSNTFNKVIEDQIDICKDILVNKAKEYATDDRLHNFKNAAGMMGCNTKEALAGMMAKHTISIYDMCRDGKEHNIDLWKEKITDHINYLLLLKAIVVEEFTDSDRVSILYANDRPYETVLKVELEENTKKDIEDIKKGLKICVSEDEGCRDCPFDKVKNGQCSNAIKQGALNAIEYLESRLKNDAT